MDYDLDNKRIPKELIVINGKEFSIFELNNKTVKGGTARVYKKGTTEMIKKYGAKAEKGITIVENATIIETDKTIPGNNPFKNALIIKMDSISFIKEDGQPLNLSGDVRVNLKGKGVVDVNGNIVANADASQKPFKEKAIASITKENPLVIIDGRISTNSAMKVLPPNDILSVNVLKDKLAIDKYSEKGKNGVIEITTKEEAKKRNLDNKTGPILMIGNLKGDRLKAADFILQKEIIMQSSSSYKFTFKNATVFFSGNGFEKVETAYLKSSDFTQLKSFLSRCKAGTAVTFVNVKAEGPDGVRTFDEKAFILY